MKQQERKIDEEIRRKGNFEQKNKFEGKAGNRNTDHKVGRPTR